MSNREMHRNPNRIRFFFAVGLAIGATGCKGGASSSADAGASTAASPASAPVAAPSQAASAGSTASNAPTTAKGCITTIVQTGHCAPAPGKMKAKDVVRWASAQGVTDPKDAADIGFLLGAGCMEVTVGAPENRGLACVMEDAVRVDKSMGDGSPVLMNLALSVLTVDGHKLVELASAPLGVYTGSDELFRAPWTIDPAARALDIAPDAEDCKAASGLLTTYWAAEKKKDPSVAAIVDRERQLSVTRVDTVCRAPRRYPFAAHPIARK